MRLNRAYTTVALAAFNTCVLLLLLNVGLWAIFSVQDYLAAPKRDPVEAKYGKNRLGEVYPDLTEDKISELLSETWSRPYVYEPFTQFKERPYKGKYVGVDENGFRYSKNQGPWPPVSDYFNVFVFGGSTTFGYGLPDAQTIPSHLQEVLNNRSHPNVRVYNFGRGYYYSSQERILFEKLLVDGFVPDMAVFIDGLNEFYHLKDEPLYTRRFTHVVDGESSRRTGEPSFFEKLPMGRAAEALRRYIRSEEDSVGQPGADPSDLSGGGENFDADYLIKRYFRNVELIRAVGDAFGSRVVLVWQPVPMYKYDAEYHLFADATGFAQHENSRLGFEYMATYVKANPLGRDHIWCADIQENLKKPLYVDLVHYTAEMARIIAICIADELKHRELLSPLRRSQDS